jgi:hypothetical protein
MKNIGFGKRIYTKRQLEELATFRNSQGMCRAYLAESTEMGYIGRIKKIESGLALES